MRGGMGGGGEVSLGGSGGVGLGTKRGGMGGGGLGGRGGGFPVGKEGPEENGACGKLTTIFSGSLLCSEALPVSLGLGVTGVLAGDCLNTAPGEPKLGLTSGDTSSLLLLPITSGLGWFFPRRSLGRIPGDFKLSPGHLLSQFLRLIVSEFLGSISTERAHR